MKADPKSRTILAAVLTWVADPALAQSIVGDIEEGRCQRRGHSRIGAEVWYWRVVLGILFRLVAHRLVRGVRGCVRALRFRGLGGELRQAARSLARRPTGTAVIVATLALGFGLNTAIFSVVHGVLFQPLPFDRSEDVVFVQGTRRGEPPSPFGTSYADYLDLARDQRTLGGLATTGYWTFTVTGLEVPMRVVGNRVSGSFFPLVGRRPALGRWIDTADDRAGGPEVIVISHGFWQRVFGGDPAVVGRRVGLNGESAQVIGVMPAGFTFPFEDIELWAPMLGEFDGNPRQLRFFATIGRLKPGVTLAAAQADFTALATALEAQYPSSNLNWRPVLRPALPVLTDGARPRLVLLFVAVVVVLLVACINVTTLILSRAAARRREFSVRAALGAGRWRLARVTLLESTWLGVTGLGLGLAIAMPSVRVLRSLAPEAIPRLSSISLNWTVAGFAALAMAAFVGVSAVAPIVATRAGHPSWMRSATVAGSRRSWGRRLLMVSQVAGAFVLLVATGLLSRSFSRVLAVSPGFDPTNVATVKVFLTPPTYRTVDEQIGYITRALSTLEQAPGVVAAAAVSQPPFDNDGAGSTLATAVEGRSYAPGSHPVVAYRTASPSYFRALGLHLREGRGFTGDDRRGAPLVAVVNETMAARFWPGESPLGRRFEFVDGRNAGWMTVVGVVNDVATDGLERAEAPTAYTPHVQRTLPFLRWTTLVVRTEGDVSLRLADIRVRLQAVDANQPLYGVSTMADRMATSVAERRFSVVLMLVFAGLTLTLAAMGLYGTLAQRVSERSRELGVRLALGALPRQVFRLVMAEGAGLVMAGIGVGALAIGLGVPLIRDSLFGVTSTDAWTYVVSVTALGGTTVLASALPSRAAARTDPVKTLRAD